MDGAQGCYSRQSSAETTTQQFSRQNSSEGYRRQGSIDAPNIGHQFSADGPGFGSPTDPHVMANEEHVIPTRRMLPRGQGNNLPRFGDRTIRPGDRTIRRGPFVYRE